VDYGHPLMMNLRRIGQKLGIIRPVLWVLRGIISRKYEEKFDNGMFCNIRQGDTIWDVGANIGLYTEKFAEEVGPVGRVVAFEPSPNNANRLVARMQSYANTIIKNVALSDFDGKARFYSSSVDESTDSLFLGSSDNQKEASEVDVHCGDRYLSEFPPNCVKIDVEGFELEVVKGMEATLRSSSLRALFIEVHFQILAERGSVEAPTMIVNILKDAGLKVKWTDSSHIVAVR
jgi:FkbM family methyltransferase